MSVENNAAIVSLYVVKTPDGKYFGGFDSLKGKANFVEQAIHAKTFTNKFDIKLRPEETLVELLVDLSKSAITFSEPFRPQRRQMTIPSKVTPQH